MASVVLLVMSKWDVGIPETLARERSWAGPTSTDASDEGVYVTVSTATKDPCLSAASARLAPSYVYVIPASQTVWPSQAVAFSAVACAEVRSSAIAIATDCVVLTTEALPNAPASTTHDRSCAIVVFIAAAF